jgi:hypothetical protein
VKNRKIGRTLKRRANSKSGTVDTTARIVGAGENISLSVAGPGFFRVSRTPASNDGHPVLFSQLRSQVQGQDRRWMQLRIRQYGPEISLTIGNVAVRINSLPNSSEGHPLLFRRLRGLLAKAEKWDPGWAMSTDPPDEWTRGAARPRAPEAKGKGGSPVRGGGFETSRRRH